MTDDILRRTHYNKAVIKHPGFCDRIFSENWEKTGHALEHARSTLQKEIEKGRQSIESVAKCELYEVLDAMERKEWRHALDECYDLIAVVDRTMEIIKGKIEREGEQNENHHERKVQGQEDDHQHQEGSGEQGLCP